MLLFLQEYLNMSFDSRQRRPPSFKAEPPIVSTDFLSDEATIAKFIRDTGKSEPESDKLILYSLHYDIIDRE